MFRSRLRVHPFLLVWIITLGIPLQALAQGESTTRHSPEEPRAKNLIFYVADGFGPASVTFGRQFNALFNKPFAIDDILVGTVGTASSSSRVTDSAASATAYACGLKTANGSISMDPQFESCRTILEAAEMRGMATGLVATSGITHATPAAFASHVRSRSQETDIAEQLVSSGVDVLLGGGLSNFVPEGNGGNRTDGRNLLKEAARNGTKVVTSPLFLASLKDTPVLGVFGFGHLDYDIDRDPAKQPSLAEMTAAAISLLSKDEDGFFLMVEGSRIDHAAHANDPIAHVYDIMAYDQALAVGLDFARKNPDTIVISTADHETGGLSLGRNGSYAWRPEVLTRASSSIGPLVEQVADGGDALRIVEQGLGFANLTDDEALPVLVAHSEGSARDFITAVTDLVNQRAGLGWSTGGHSGVDVHLGAFGPGSERFVGYHENDELGRLMAEVLGLEIGHIETSGDEPEALR